MHLQNVDRVDGGNILKLNNYENYLETLPTDTKIKKMFDDYSHSEYKKVFNSEDETVPDGRYLFSDTDEFNEIDEFDETKKPMKL